MHKSPDNHDPVNGDAELAAIVDRAREFFENGEFESAVATADEALQTDSSNISLLLIKGQALRQLGHFEEALECAEKGIEFDSELQGPVYLKLETLYSMQDYQNLVEMAERILSRYSGDLYTNWLYVHALIRLDNHTRALDCINCVLTEVSNDIKFLIMKAELLEDIWHDHGEAVDCYSAVLEIDSDNLHAWQEKLRLLMSLGDEDEVDRTFKQAYDHFSSQTKIPDNIKALYALGSLCETLKKFKEAVFWYEQVARTEPEHIDFWNSLAFCYYQEQDLENAIRCNDRALAIEEDAYVLFDKAHSLLRLYRSEEAVPCIEKSLKLDPWNMQAWADLSKALVFLGQDDKRKAFLKEGVQVFSEIAEKDAGSAGHCYYARGYLMRLLGDYRGAMELFKKALPLLPDYARLYDQMAVTLGELEGEDSALEYYLKAIELDPLNPEYLNNIGACLIMLGRCEDAIGYLDHAAQLSPNYAHVQHNLGTCYLELGDKEKAIDHYNRAIAMDSGDWKPHYKLGEIYAGEEELEKAIRHLEMSEKINSTESTIPLRAAYCYADLGEIDKAKECVARGGALMQGHDPYYYNTVGFVAEQEEDIDTAIRNYEKAIKYGSTREYYMNTLGRLYVRKGESRKALKAFDLAIQRDPYYVDAYINKVKVYLDKEQFDKALEVCSQALEIEPGNSLVNYWMGSIFLDIEDFNQAYFYFKRADELWPDDVSTLVNMAISLYYLEENAESLKLLERIIEEHPEEGLGYLYKGYILADEENYSEAVEYMLKAKDLNPHDTDIDDDIQKCRDALKQ